MSATTDRPSPTPAEFAPEPPSRATLIRYLAPLFLAPILLIASAFFIVPTHWLQNRSGNLYLANMGYGAKLHNQRCDILVYGDSTAMVGVDPAQVEQQTGLRTCNIAEFAGMTMVNHTALLDTFLANNPRPRYIVFLFIPEGLSVPTAWEHVGYFEAVSFRVQTRPDPSTALLLARHPVQAFTWAEQGLRMAAQHVRTRPFSATDLERRATTGGRLPISAPALTTCDTQDRAYPPDRAWVQDLRTRYATQGTRVLVDAMPTAPCDRTLSYFHQSLAGVVDDDPYPTFPIDSFTTDGRLHVNATGAQRLSALIAGQIQQAEHARGAN